MGIGLFHSKKIIEAHQGRIEVESEDGKGSTFRVLLPLKTVQSAAEPQPKTSATEGPEITEILAKNNEGYG
jgi:hypothetical protein